MEGGVGGGGLIDLMKSSTAGTDEASPPEKTTQKRQKTSIACYPCQKSHYPCDEGRPCQSCLKRNKGERCIDGFRRKVKYMEAAVPDSKLAENTTLMLLAETVNKVDAPPFTISDENIKEEIRPFNYGPKYHIILEMLQKRLETESMKRICKAFAQFRPPLIAQLRSLQEEDLILMERSFLRTILELERVLPLTGASHCVWRRTGEVAYVSHEFSVLTGWTKTSLCDGRRMIFEILDERGIVKYWEQYAECVLERNAHNFKLTCDIIRADGKCLHGAMWITVRKDIFDIPLAIVGCFLPNLWHPTIKISIKET